LKPDYGLRLLRDGVAREVDHFFYDFRLYSLTVLGRAQYSTMVELPHDGEVYALSVDFSGAQLNAILSKAPARVAAFIGAELARDPVTPRTIDLDGSVSFGIRARLGQLQRAARENFVPLVCEQIF
jgi:hypothetical protein